MRVVVVGLGVQGVKRKNIAGTECIATVDPVNLQADYRDIQQIAIDSYDGVLLCVPDNPKYDLIKFALENNKHVLVEKPLWCATSEQIKELESLAIKNNLILYTAYNHRFEPHYVKMHDLIKSETLGKIYHCRLFYGNGTARQVRESEWRDKGDGVLPDLGSHLLDILHYWFGNDIMDHRFATVSKRCFENRAPDHVIFADYQSKMTVEAEVTLLSWRNHFTCDIFAENGSAHIESLCKWGPSTFVYRQRILPSGRPIETSETLVQSDPTWQLEYEYFKDLCLTKKTIDSPNRWIYKQLASMGQEELLIA